jgi:hypothetical protein
VNPDSVNRGPSNRIVLTDDDLKQLATVWIMAWPRAAIARADAAAGRRQGPGRGALSRALALGLDKDDTIVKRQLARKMEFLAEDVSKLEEPKPGELKAWYENNQATIRAAARVFFPPCLLSLRTAVVRRCAPMPSAH